MTVSKEEKNEIVSILTHLTAKVLDAHHIHSFKITADYGTDDIPVPSYAPTRAKVYNGRQVIKMEIDLLGTAVKKEEEG